MIPENLLQRYSGRKLTFRKGETLFYEGSEAAHYHQLAQGNVKMITRSQDGKEFIQGLFQDNESFGEPPLFCGIKYPGSAIAVSESQVWRLPKDRFFDLLRENFSAHLEFDRVLCDRLRYKNMILSSMSFLEPEQLILNLLGYYRSKSLNQTDAPRKFVVPLTRQEIADMSGLRVETVIRTVKRMEKEGKLQIERHKILI